MLLKVLMARLESDVDWLPNISNKTTGGLSAAAVICLRFPADAGCEAGSVEEVNWTVMLAEFIFPVCWCLWSCPAASSHPFSRIYNKPSQRLCRSPLHLWWCRFDHISVMLPSLDCRDLIYWLTLISLAWKIMHFWIRYMLWNETLWRNVPL